MAHRQCSSSLTFSLVCSSIIIRFEDERSDTDGGEIVVKKLECFIRSPSYVVGNIVPTFAKEGENFACTSNPFLLFIPIFDRKSTKTDLSLLLPNVVTEKQKEVLANDPATTIKLRKAIEGEMNSRFKFMQKGSAEQNTAQQVS